MFTQRHFVEIAKVLRSARKILSSRGEHALFSVMVQNFEELFRENPKFDKEKFLVAIYGKEEK